MALPSQQPVVVSEASKSSAGAVGARGGTGGGASKGAAEQGWQQWSQILADQQRMLHFQQMLAMSPVLPNMTAKDMAVICGLTESDLAGLSSYTLAVTSLNPSQLAGMGITSSQLHQLSQIASLTKTSPATLASQAKKQAQFEQEFLMQRHPVILHQFYLCQYYHPFFYHLPHPLTE